MELLRKCNYFVALLGLILRGLTLQFSGLAAAPFLAGRVARSKGKEPLFLRIDHSGLGSGDLDSGQLTSPS